MPHKRRIAQHMAAARGRQHGGPVEREGVAVHDVRARDERNACKVLAKLLAHAQVHLVVHQPQRDLGDLRGEFFDLDAVELIDVHADEAVHVDAALAALALQFGGGAQHVQFEQTQLAVADDQKVATAAGRVEKAQGAQLFVKVEQPVALVPHALELGAQAVEEQRLDELEDVFLGRCSARPGCAAPARP